MKMQNQRKTIQKIIGGFLGVASASVFIIPGLAQANTSKQSIIAQTSSPGGTMSAPTTNSSPNSNPSTSNLDTEFITKAAQSDMTEIQTSKLALQKSRNKSVRDFAQQMIKQHTESSRELKPIAMSKKVMLPKDIGPENTALLTSLKKVSGSQFDQAYMQGQVQAHTNTLAEYQKYLDQGQDPQLKAFASKISPLVAQHLQMAQKMVATR
ncbi:outer membrane protein [Tolypothrix sp. NIES-4075]|nr:outer membrane protein [Tolypothrix sp. NIES-4075]